MDIRNLGVFPTMSAVWAAYPSGGREGDYLFIGADEETGTKYRWNIYALLWENAAVVTDTTGRQYAEFSDIQVQNDVNIAGVLNVSSISSDDTIHVHGNINTDRNLSVGGDLTISGSAQVLHVEWPYVGRFVSDDALEAAYPDPKVGWWAHVGTGDELVIYRCDEDGTWSETEENSTQVGPAVITAQEMASVLT